MGKPAEYAGFQDGMKLVNELAAELTSLIKVRDALPPQHWARISIRSVFAMLEAFVSRFKGRALEAQKYGKVTFSPKLLRILEEGQSVSHDDGTVDWENIRPRTSDNIKGSVRAFSKAMGTDTPLGGPLPLPPEFVLALGARNRVTHPKTLKDLVITREEIVAVAEVLKWLMELSTWARDQEVRNINEMKAKMNADFDALRNRIRDGLPERSKSIGSEDDNA